MDYLINVFYSFDRAGSALLGLDKDETISSLLGKLYLKNVYTAYPMVYLVDLAFLILTGFKQTTHCLDSIQRNEGIFTDKYDGAVKPKNVVKYVIPLQLLGVVIFWYFSDIVDFLIIWN